NGVHSLEAPPSWNEYWKVAVGEPAGFAGTLAVASSPTRHCRMLERTLTGVTLTASEGGPQNASVWSRHPRYCTDTGPPYGMTPARNDPGVTSTNAPPLSDTWNFSTVSEA